jgi:hypothetical protein
MVNHKKMGGKRKCKKGGDSQAYELMKFGDMNTQYNNVFRQVPGVSNNSIAGMSNALRTLSGKLVGGSRHKRCGGTRKKRGGFWGQLINQAIVPFGLLGLQQTYGRKKRGGKTKKHH